MTVCFCSDLIFGLDFGASNFGHCVLGDSFIVVLVVPGFSLLEFFSQGFRVIGMCRSIFSGLIFSFVCFTLFVRVLDECWPF